LPEAGTESLAEAQVMTVHLAVEAGSGKVIPLPLGLRDALTALSRSH
jgi:acyl-CoA thioesterase FadM